MSPPPACLTKSNPDYLSKREKESEVAVYFISLESFSSFDSFPGGRNLDEDLFSWNVVLLVQSDESLGLLNRGLLVEAESGVDLRGDNSRNEVKDSLSELDGQLVANYGYELALVFRSQLSPDNRLLGLFLLLDGTLLLLSLSLSL